MTGAGVVQSASTIGFETLYAGYRWDGASPQMYYVRNRFLLPQVGTWNRRDPLGYVDGMNLSVYKQTVMGTDPVGLFDGEKVSARDLWDPISFWSNFAEHYETPVSLAMKPSHWIFKEVYIPLSNSLYLMCSNCIDCGPCTMEACKKESQRLAAAIANTYYWNYSSVLYSLERVAGYAFSSQKMGGYYCYEWASAFRQSFYLERNVCFDATVNSAQGAMYGKERPVHYWVTIESVCGGKVFVDDGFMTNGYVHATPPCGSWTIVQEPGWRHPWDMCESVIDDLHPKRNRPTPYCAAGNPNGVGGF